MKRKIRQIKNLILTVLTVIACAVFVTSAWATLSLVKPNDAYPMIDETATEQISGENTEAESSAPEPSSIMLFGSGLFGMIVSFLRKTYAAAKRGFDIVASIIGMILLSPLFLVTALLIKLSSKGPIIYKQTRVGKYGKLFDIYKFRTMKVDAEKNTGPVWAREKDDRLIPVGNFLRKAHIDEIPQFVNILKGEMSLIGPRPERPVFVKKFTAEIQDYEKRLEVKPGLTGLAQVWHKYDETIEDVKKKIKYDLLYIKKICLWTDIGILFRTVRVVLTGEGAR